MLNIIAQYAQKHNTVTLLRTIEHMGNSFDDLTAQEQIAYEHLYGEMMQFVQQQNS